MELTQSASQPETPSQSLCRSVSSLPAMRSLLLLCALCMLPALCLAAPTWHRSQYQQAVMMGVRMSDEKLGFVVGGDNGVGASIVRTQDGGRSFSRVPIDDTIMFAGVSGHAGGRMVASGLSLMGFGGAQYTDDGEQFFNSSMPERLNYLYNLDVQMLPDGTNRTFVMPGNVGFFPEEEGGEEAPHRNRLLVSRDGGRSFPELVDIGLDQQPERVNARYLALPSANVALVTAGAWPMRVNEEQMQGSLALSERVQLQRRAGRPAMSLRQRQPDRRVSTDSGYLGYVQLSTDGMRTFKTVLNSTEWYPQHICCPSVSTCYVIAENARNAFVYKTSDGGSSWDLILQRNSSESLWSCASLSEDELFIGGAMLYESEGQPHIDGTMYHTTDGGRSFEQTQVPDAYLVALDFLDSKRGFGAAMNPYGGSNFMWYSED